MLLLPVGIGILAASLFGCAHHHPVAAPTPPPPPAPAPSPPRSGPPAKQPPLPPRMVPGEYVEEGIASWYGVPYHGRRAANGEIYDMYKMTAAHRTLPFDSIVRVTNLKNGRTADVRINDRGPFVENRVIDLSLAAARELDMVAAGIARVRIQLVSASSPLTGNFTVQVGAFRVRENAERLRARMEQRYSAAFLVQYDAPDGTYYRVRVGRLPSQDAARQFAERLKTEEGFTPFVVRLDE